MIANHQDATLLPVKVAEAMQWRLLPAEGPLVLHKCGIAGEHRVAADPFHVTEHALVAPAALWDFMGKLPGKRVLLMASSGFLSGTLEAEREEIVNRARCTATW